MSFKTECVCCCKEIEVNQEAFCRGEMAEALCDHCEEHENCEHCEH